MINNKTKHQHQWGKVSIGIISLVSAIAAVIGGGSAVVGTKLLPEFLSESVIDPVVETPKKVTPDKAIKGFTMGNLPADEPVTSIKVEVTVGADGDPLKERVDLHLGSGFPFRLYPVGGDSLAPAFAAFPQESTLKRGENSIEPGSSATFDFSASDSGGQDTLGTTPQLLRDLKVGDLQSIGFASQGSNNWVLSGYRIEVNGKLFAENDSVNLAPRNILGEQRDQLAEVTPQNEALMGEIANLEAFVATGLASPNDEAELAKKKAESEKVSGPLNSLAGQSAGAYPWFLEGHESFKPAGSLDNRVKQVEVMVVAGGGDKPGTRNPLFVRLGNKKYLLTSEVDPLDNDPTPQIFTLGEVDLAGNPLSPDDLKKPGLGLIGNEERFGTVPDRAKVQRLSIKSGGETIYDSEIATEDRQALTTYWLRPPAHLDESGAVQKNPETDNEKHLWLSGMVVPDIIAPAPIVIEPDPIIIDGGGALPPPIPGPIGGGLTDGGGIGNLPGVGTGTGGGTLVVNNNLPPAPNPITNTGLQNANLPIGVIQGVTPNIVTGQGAGLGQAFTTQLGNIPNPNNRIILGGPPPPPPFNSQLANNQNGIFSPIRRTNRGGGNSPFVNPVNSSTFGGGTGNQNAALTGNQITNLIQAVANLLKPVPPQNPTAATIKDVLITDTTRIEVNGTVPTVKWNVVGNTSQISSFRIELLPVLPHRASSNVGGAVTQAVVPAASRLAPMQAPIILPPPNTGFFGSVPRSEWALLYVQPKVTALDASGNALQGAATGPLMPLFPEGTGTVSKGGTSFLTRGIRNPPTDHPDVGGFQPFSNAAGPPTTFNWAPLGTVTPFRPINSASRLLTEVSIPGFKFDFVEGKGAGATTPFFNSAGRTHNDSTVRMIYEGLITYPTAPITPGTLRGYRLVGHYGFVGTTASVSDAKTGNFGVSVELSAAGFAGDNVLPLPRDLFGINQGPNLPFFVYGNNNPIEVKKRSGIGLHLIDIPIRFDLLDAGAGSLPHAISPLVNGAADFAGNPLNDAGNPMNAGDFAAYNLAKAAVVGTHQGPMTVTVTIFMDSKNATLRENDSIGLMGLRLVPDLYY